MSFSEVFTMYKTKEEDMDDVEIPYNLFIINTVNDAERALRRLAKLIGKKEKC